jgi:hypothetical protein
MPGNSAAAASLPADGREHSHRAAPGSETRPLRPAPPVSALPGAVRSAGCRRRPFCRNDQVGPSGEQITPAWPTSPGSNPRPIGLRRARATAMNSNPASDQVRQERTPSRRSGRQPGRRRDGQWCARMDVLCGHVCSGHGWPTRPGRPVRSCVPGRTRAAFILASVRVRGESSQCSDLARPHRWVARLRRSGLATACPGRTTGPG